MMTIIYVVMENHFDGVHYSDKVVKVFESEKDALQFFNSEPGDLYVEPHELIKESK